MDNKTQIAIHKNQDQIGKIMKSKDMNIQKCLSANLMRIVLKNHYIIVLNICGLITINMNLHRVAGMPQFVEELEHTGCSMIEKFNGSVLKNKQMVQIWRMQD